MLTTERPCRVGFALAIWAQSCCTDHHCRRHAMSSISAAAPLNKTRVVFAVKNAKVSQRHADPTAAMPRSLRHSSKT